MKRQTKTALRISALGKHNPVVKAVMEKAFASMPGGIGEDGIYDVKVNAIVSVLEDTAKYGHLIYRPEKGDVVLVRDYLLGVWQKQIASGAINKGWYGVLLGGNEVWYKYCRPFDPAMIGKTDNP